MTFREVVANGDHLTTLQATRDQIAADLEACESMRDKAALYLRLADVLDRVEQAKPPVAKGDVVDQIAERRAARRSGPPKPAGRAKRSG